MPEKPSYEELEQRIRELQRAESQREQAEEALRESEERYRELFNFSPSAALVTQEERIVFVNPAAVRLFGVKDQAEIIGSSPNDWIRRDFARQARQRRFRAIEMGESLDPVEFVLVRKDKREAVVVANATYITYHGSPALLSVFQDITAYKRAQEALRKSERFFKSVIQLSPIGIAMVDTTGKLIECNEALAKMLGYTADELKSISFERFTHPEDIEKEWQLINKVWAGEKDHYQIEKRYITRDKRHIWVNVVGSVFRAEKESESFGFALVDDITERKRGEEALRKSEARFNWAMEASKDGIWDTDLKTGKTYFSPGYLKMLGFESHEVEGPLQFWKDFTHPEDTAFVERANRDCVENHCNDFEVEFRMQAKDGEWRWILGRGMAVARDEDGHATRMIGTHTDITERKQSEEALRESEERFRLLSDVTMEGVLIHRQGIVMDVNSALARLLGYERDELVGKNILEVAIHRGDRHIVQQNIIKEYAQPYTVRIVKKNGQVFFAELEARNFESKGEVLRVVAVRDITERKRAEDALVESEQRYRALFERTLNPAAIISTDGRYLDANPAFLNFVEKTKEQLLKMSVFDFSPPGEKIHQETDHKEIWKTGGTVETTYFIDGKEKILDLTVSPMDYMGQKAILGTGKDITESKRLQTQLHQAQKMESIGRLAGGIAHDFNNILSIILGNTDLAMFDVPEWSPARENLRELREASLRARELVTQILVFARQKDQAISHIRLKPIAEESLKMLRSSIPTTVEIRQAIEAGLPPILGDPSQIQQIIMNLCTNAGQVMESEGGVMEFELDSTILDGPLETSTGKIPEGRYVRLRVKDSGPGILTENLEHIFEPFFTTKGVGEGTGLGLAVVHGIVKEREGGIIVESKEGEGTAFTVYLRAAEGGSVEEETKTKPVLRKGSERILYVDDEPMIMKLGKRMLERQGYQVEARTDSADALAWFKKDPKGFDLVITDMTMPGIRGDLFAKEILAIRPDIPVILSTGYSNLISEEKAKDLGIRAFVMKPLTQNELLGTVHKVLNE